MIARPARRPVVALLLAVLTLLVVVACGSDDTDTRSETAGLPATPQDLEAHEWVLAPDDSRPAIEVGQRVTIAFADGVVSGTGPCNTFRASLSFTDAAIGITGLATTLRACDPPVTAAEVAYVAALEVVDHAEVSDGGDRLVLSGEDDDVALTYVAASD